MTQMLKALRKGREMRRSSLRASALSAALR